MEFAQYQSISFINIDLPKRPTSIVSCAIKSANGGTLNATATYTTSSVNTTVTGSVAAGSTTITVSSSTGITAGSKYLIGTGEDTLGEFTTIKSISSNTLTTLRPVQATIATGTAFTGTRVQVQVGTTESATVSRHNRIDLVYVTNGVSGSISQTFDVVRFFPLSNLTMEDIKDFDPTFNKKIHAGTNFEAIKSKAWDMILTRVAGKTPVGSIVGTLDLTAPHQYLVRRLVAETAGPEYKEYADEMGKRFMEELEEVLQSHTVDKDQDGTIGVGDVYPTFIRLIRR